MHRTVTAFGRSWSHQQFYGLVRACIDHRVSVAISGWPGCYEVEVDNCGPLFAGTADTPFLALCEAVEKMEESHGD